MLFCTIDHANTIILYYCSVFIHCTIEISWKCHKKKKIPRERHTVILLAVILTTFKIQAVFLLIINSVIIFFEVFRTTNMVEEVFSVGISVF